MIETLAKLVGFNTVSDRDVRELAEFVADRLDGFGFRIERVGPPEHPGKFCLIASAGPTETDGLVLSGHMDVVPTEGQPWSSDPFELVEHDGRLYGRGTADMKGFLASVLEALSRVPVRALRKELVLIWTYDEEVGCLGSARLVGELGGRSLPTACLIGEPTDFEILRMHPGHVAVEISVAGRAAHSSRPELGVNAIDAAADAVRALRGIGGEVPVNIARIQGGTALNIVPDQCVVELGYRPPPGVDSEELFQQIRTRLDALESSARVSARILRITPSLSTPVGTPLEALLTPYASRPGTGMASFATDGGNLARLGTKPLVFGPGSIEVAHQANEYVEKAALLKAADLVEHVIGALCAA